MKKIKVLTVAFLVTVFGMVSANALYAKQFVLNHADWNPPQAQLTKITIKMLDMMEQNSNGRIKVNKYWSGALLKQSETYRGVQTGMADIAYFGPNIPGAPVKLGDLISLPFLGITSHRMTTVVYERLFRESPELQAEYKGVLVKSIFGISNDNISTKNKLVKVPEDIQGMKILTIGSRTEFMKAVGAVPVMIDPGEWYTSLDKGLVEGMYFLTPVIAVFKIENQFNYHTIINGSATVNMFIINERKYNSLPDDLKKVVDDAFAWRVKAINDFSDREEREVHADLKKRGQTIYYANEEELAQWAALAKPIHEKWIKTAEKRGLPGRVLFNRMMKIIAEVKKDFK